MNIAIKFILKYLILIGVGIAVSGLVAGFISGWDALAMGLIIAGTVLMVIWLLIIDRLGEPGQPQFWQRRSTQAGTNAFVATLSVLVILTLFNFVAVRNEQRFDLTENQIFSLAPETKQVLKNLRQPVKLYIFSRDRNAQDQVLIDRFKDQTTKLEVEYIDPQANPVLAQRFEIKNDLVNQEVYLERFSKFKNQPVKQLVQRINTQERLSESQLTNGLIRVLSEVQPKVYFLQGHGEKTLEPGKSSMSVAAKGLTDRNFLVEPLNLAQVGEVPIDAAVIVIAGPQKPLFEPEVQLLEAFQAQGGSLLVLLDPRTQTGLDPLLAKWGIKLDDRLAIDGTGIGQQLSLGPAAPIVQNYSDHPITRNFSNMISFYPFARPLEILDVPDVRLNPIVLTAPRSWADANPEEQPKVRFTEGEDRMGPLPIGVALSRVLAIPPTSPPASPNPQPQETRMVVFGNTGFAIDGYFNQAINGDVLINSVSWLSQSDAQPMSVRSRNVKNRRIIPSAGLVQGLFITSVVVVPLLGLLAAIALWWRRR
ncbi:MAG: hypothetical protein RLZZ511_60 [Cyanobacteriota bacterium]|jgi:ABC-type uncharacterized transport system involved in gliding motility auxiliary subunit